MLPYYGEGGWKTSSTARGEEQNRETSTSEPTHKFGWETTKKKDHIIRYSGRRVHMPAESLGGTDANRLGLSKNEAQTNVNGEKLVPDGLCILE
jgi:hypothetical protein